MAVIPLPPVIINHFGKLTLAAAAAALSGLAYAQRERISRWLDDGDLGTTPHAQDKVLTDLHSKLPEAQHKKHSELMDKLASSNTNAVAELKGLINDIHEELGSMTENFQGELDAQRREVRALGRELHEAIASLKARQDTVEALVNSSPREERVSDGKGEPSASPAPSQTTGRTTASGGKRKGNGPAGPDSRPA